ncbi:MAG: DUF885 family protein [Thermobifida fusca]|jgi:hypothetical protein|nr:MULTISPECIES: DUF885 family protein [Thermobifida]
MSSPAESSHPDPGVNAMTDRFRATVERILDQLCADRPEWGLQHGDVRYAGQLADQSPEAWEQHAEVLADGLRALDDIDDTLLPVADRVDLEMLRTHLSADLWRTTELRPHTWDPLHTLPDKALTAILHHGPLRAEERLAALTAYCAALPDALHQARLLLDDGPGMPRPHVTAASRRARRAAAMLEGDVELLLAAVPDGRAELSGHRADAHQAFLDYAAWLESRVEDAAADPRLGEPAYAAQLWYTLDSELDPHTLLTRAESDLIATEEELAEVAAAYTGQPRRIGQVREVLDQLAAESACPPDEVRSLCAQALDHLVARTAELDLVTVPASEVRLTAPDPRGPAARPLDGAGRIAVAPPAADGPWGRLAHHRDALRILMAYEAVPGRGVQAAHAARYQGPTRVRSVLRSSPFIEGWAGYITEQLACAGWHGDGGETDQAARLAQLTVRLRTILNAIVDVRFHTGDLDEPAAMALLTQRGHYEEGEAARTWRCAQLTSTRLTAPYVGYRELSDIVRELAADRPHERRRDRHDAVLAHGAPAPRQLRVLLGAG